MYCRRQIVPGIVRYVNAVVMNSLIGRMCILLAAFLLAPLALAAQTTGKRPVIVIPGITGSELVDRNGKKVWFSTQRNKDDDLRLPMTSPILSRNRDGLRAPDIIREVKLPVLPDIEVYQAVIDALKERGYAEADWSRPKAEDVFYVFPYDWRRDNVETAHLLIRRMTAVKRALRRPDLKFDIIAHSMGGLVARYAAMYGLKDLPTNGRPSPNWSGATHIGKLLMFGTPNEGSMGSFEALIKGIPLIAGRRLPLVDDPRPEDVMSNPSVFQLLPHHPRFIDEELKPLNIDLFDVDTWLKYGWGALTDPKFLSRLKDAASLAVTNKEVKPVALDKDAGLDDRLTAALTYSQVRSYFSSALRRARLFQLALDAPVEKPPIQLYAYGGNCEPTLDAVLILQDKEDEKWHTYFDARDIKTSSGAETKKEAVKAVMFAPGDGRVTEGSLLRNGNGALFPIASSFFACSSHTKLFLDKPIKDSFLSALVVEKQIQP